MSSVVLCSTRMDGLQLQLPNLPEQTHCPLVISVSSSVCLTLLEHSPLFFGVNYILRP